MHGTIDGVDSGLSLRARVGVPAGDAAIVIHPSVLAHSLSAAGYSTTAADRDARDGRQLGVCVDRIDYTKGIPERLRALDTLWEQSPELRGRFTFLFVATPSRSNVPAYNTLEREVVETTIAINKRYGSRDW